MLIQRPAWEEAPETLTDVLGGLPGGDDLQPFLSVS